MLGRRRDREVREQAAQLAARLAEDVHARLRADAVDAVIGRPQNRDLSGHEGEMLLNAAYLVDREAVGRLRERVAELEEAHRRARRAARAARPAAALQLHPRGPGMTTESLVHQDVALVDLIDRLLGSGVVIAGDITLSVAGIDLVYVGLRALVTSVATAVGEEPPP